MAVNAKGPDGQGGGLPDKSWVGRSFGRAADSYDGLADLQRRTADTLLAEVFQTATVPGRILDVGAGTGYPAGRLCEQWPQTQLLALDLAEGMLQVAQRRLSHHANVRFICADAESLPLAHASVDVVFSSLALQWCVDLPAALAECWRVLKPGGLFLFSTFGPETLVELKRAWATVDTHTHVLGFQETAAIRRAVEVLKWETCELRSLHNNLAYPDVYALMHELKGLGAHNVTRDRPRHLQGKSAWKRMLAAYPAACSGDGITAAFEIITVHCRK